MQSIIAHNLDEKERTKDILISEDFYFDSLMLRDTTLQGLKEAGFYKPSPIQLKAIPLGRCGLDLIVKAKSGTGKTAVFTIIALEMVKTTTNNVQVLIFAPTREIAVQIEDVIKTIGKGRTGLQVGSFIGGMPLEDDIKKLKCCHIAVGAPGRLKHLIEAGHLKLNSVRLLVLDEADKLMMDSFQSDINYVYHHLPTSKQVIAASATYDNGLDKFLERYMQSPTFITPKAENSVLLGLRQFVTVVKSHLLVAQQQAIKTEEVDRLLSKIPFTQCLIFFNSQLRVESMSNILNEKNWKTMSVSAAQSQSTRLKAINSLKNLQCRILLSTDLTARGIDAANVDLVINYDVPQDAATYLHRMGRAGRYGSRGLCVTIAATGKELAKFQLILGEIGGPQLSVAKLPGGDLINVWDCDLGLFETLHGVVDDAQKSNKTNLQTSVFDMKSELLQNGDRDTESMATNLERLSVVEGEREVVENGTHEQDGVENETCGTRSSSVRSLLKKSWKIDKNIRQKLKHVDSETLLQNLALGKDVIPDKEALGENEEEKDALVDPRSLYPWVPFEGPSVFRDLTNCTSLLEEATTADEEDSKLTEPSMRKRKRTQFKNTDSSDSKNAILIKNLALYNISKLLTTRDASSIDSDSSNAIRDYLNVAEENDRMLVIAARSLFESCPCSDLLTNLEHYTEQWRQHQLVRQPHEAPDPDDLMKRSYLFFCGDLPHWKDALGDSNQSEEEEDVDVAEDDVQDLEDEEEQSYEYAEYVTSWRSDGNPSRKQKYSRWEQETKPTDQTEESTAHEPSSGYDYGWQSETQAQFVAETAISNVEHQYNPQYASYFRHYMDRLRQDGSTFEDIPSFDNYFDQFRLRMQQVRDLVQQNIYLQEMNNYQYATGQNFFS